MNAERLEIQEFYFANGRFILKDAEDFTKLSKFRNHCPYQYSVEMNTTEADIPECGDGICFDDISAVAECDNGYLFSLRWDGGKPHTALWISRDYENAKYYRAKDQLYKSGTDIEIEQNDRALDHLRTVYDAILPMHGGSIIHSSCIVHKEEALLFCGPSKMGKSTQARLWQSRFNVKYLSSDAPAVFPEKDQQGNSVIRAYGMPWDGSDQITVQDNAVVKAVIELRQAPFNSVRRLTETQAFRMLLKQGHMPMWDEDAMFSEMMVLKKISKLGRFYRLCCKKEESAAELIDRVIFNNSMEELIAEETEMKIKDGYKLKKVMDDYIVMPTGDEMKSFEGAIVLTETSAFVWKLLKDNISESEIVQRVLAEYDADPETVKSDVQKLLQKLDSFGVLEKLD